MIWTNDLVRLINIIKGILVAIVSQMESQSKGKPIRILFMDSFSLYLHAHSLSKTVHYGYGLPRYTMAMYRYAACAALYIEATADV